jgi:hypothetical protein
LRAKTSIFSRTPEMHLEWGAPTLSTSTHNVTTLRKWDHLHHLCFGTMTNNQQRKTCTKPSPVNNHNPNSNHVSPIHQGPSSGKNYVSGENVLRISVAAWKLPTTALRASHKPRESHLGHGPRGNCVGHSAYYKLGHLYFS